MCDPILKESGKEESGKEESGKKESGKKELNDLILEQPYTKEILFTLMKRTPGRKDCDILARCARITRNFTVCEVDDMGKPKTFGDTECSGKDIEFRLFDELKSPDAGC